jgi:Metallo-beta-lactamase superfamily
VPGSVAHTCVTCGAQYPPSPKPPAECLICLDERQYVGFDGQRWTDAGALRTGYEADVRTVEPGLTGIGSTPEFAIGQRPLLIETAEGNVLWDCLAPFTETMVAAARERGGVDAIAVSHPHFYTSMVEWSHAFDAPIHLSAADREWVTRPDEAIRFWDGDRLELPGGITLIRLGGHFAGGTVLHWPAGAEGRGALLTGDVVSVVPDRRFVSFMRSYPNLIPLPAATVEAMVAALEPFEFDRIYGSWWERFVIRDAHDAVRRSAARYVQAITEGRGD